MKLTTIGIDLAKTVFQVHGVTAGGEVVRKRLSRVKLLRYMARREPCLVGLEACGGAHHWARELGKLGHEVRLMSPQYVKPYVKTNKNDGADAEAICEAAGRPNMRFVPIKTRAQQDVQALHRVRAGLIKARTALSNQARGLAAEYGVVLPRGLGRLRAGLPGVVEDAHNALTEVARELLWSCYQRLRELDGQIQAYEARLEGLHRADEASRRLSAIEGIGPLTATALRAAVGDAREFRNGRHLAAWLGLVPRQHSSGPRQVLLGISKRGDRYLRSLLIHGARAVLSRSAGKSDRRSRWLEALKARRGFNRACVALANRNARIAWALLARGQDYRPAL